MPERLLAEMRSLTARLEQLDWPSLPKQLDDPLAMAHLSAIMHQKRAAAFPAGYFADASWEILIDLFIARHEGHKMIISDLGLTANVPPTTISRHLSRLVEDQFVVKVNDQFDRRKSYVQLTDHGTNVLVGLLQSTQVAAEKQLERRASSPISIGRRSGTA